MKNYKIGIGCGVSNGISIEVIDRALKLGIRYFDTSTFYAIGAIDKLEARLSQLNIPRDEVHISLKLWWTQFGKNRSTDYEAAGMSLAGVVRDWQTEFNCQRFDSVVVHWPLKADLEGYPDEFIIAEIWPQMEALVDHGVTCSIGVSNFNIVEMHRLLDVARIKPCFNQVEFNPFAHDLQLVDFCSNNGIPVVGHTPFSFGWTNGHLRLFENDTIIAIAEKHNITPAHVVLSWVISKGVIPIPGTTKPVHVDDFANAARLEVLMRDDISAIDGLNTKKFHYLDIYHYFGGSHHRKYFQEAENIHALVFNEAREFEKVSIFDNNFMPAMKHALTDGAGFAILPGIFAKVSEELQKNVIVKQLNSANRWNGLGPGLSNVINSGPEVLEIVDDPLLSLVIESLLGWDCKLDNISLSTSRVAPDNAIFGPHQDSPFDNNPGAPLPPPNYPMVLQVIVALDEFRDDNGPLYVIPDTHKNRSRVVVPWQGNLPFGQIPEGALKVIVPKGSAILAVGHIWHGTFANESKDQRMGMLIEYVLSVCDARDKFKEGYVAETLLNTCSRRVIRLFNNGKMHQHDTPTLLHAFKEARKKSLPSFAIES